MFAVTTVADPPTTVPGVIVSVLAEAGNSVNVHVLVTPDDVAVIVTGVLEATPDVVTPNVAVVAPAATVTELGTVTDELFADKLTTVPPVGAGTSNVTVPVGLLPPTIDVGETLTDDRPPGLTVKVPVTVVVFVAEIVTVCAEDTPSVVIVKFVFEVCAGIVTVAGTVAADVLELKRVTTDPDGPALPLRWIFAVTVVELPPITVFGVIVSE